jgi:hypothetical protein
MALHAFYLKPHEIPEKITRLCHPNLSLALAASLWALIFEKAVE